MLCFDSTFIAFDKALGSVLNEGQVAVVVWLSIGCLSCSGICRTPYGISVKLYPLLSMLRKVACSLTSSAGLRWCGPCVLRWAALRNLSLCGRAFLPLGTHICVFALLRTAVHLSVSVHNKRSLSVHGALHILGLLVGSTGSCSVLLLRVATLPSAGSTTITVAHSNTWKNFVIFILRHILSGSSNQ
jgi:hypothetical protein